MEFEGYEVMIMIMEYSLRFLSPSLYFFPRFFHTVSGVLLFFEDKGQSNLSKRPIVRDKS